MGLDELERALELKRAGRLDEAVIALEALLVGEPRNAFALGHLAHCQLRRGRAAEALAELDKADDAGGVTAFTARTRGDALYRLKRYRQAGAAYEEADALGDRDVWTLAQLARCRLHDNDLDGARDAASRAVERDAGSASGWVMLGEVAARAGDAAQAEEHFQRAHELAPDDQYAYAKLVEARLLQLPPDERRRELDVLLRSSGRENRFLANVHARLLKELGDADGAAAVWRGRRGARDDHYVRSREAYALREAGRLREAAALLRDVLFEEPGSVIHFRTYVSLMRGLGELDGLRQTLQEFLPVAGPRKGATYAELRKLESGEGPSSRE